MGTYPEILLQYTKSRSLVNGKVDEETWRIVNSLHTRTVGEWAHSEHCHVLSWLVNECLESKRLRGIIDSRMVAHATLSKESAKAKRAAEAAKAEKDAAATQTNQEPKEGEGANDKELTKAADGAPTDADATDAVPAPQSEPDKDIVDPDEQRRKEKMLKLRIRAQTVGRDRNRTAYFWNLAHDSSCIYAHHSDNTWSKIRTESELAETEKSLNVNGVRELRLSKNIAAIRTDIVDGMKIAAEIAMFPASVPVNNRENVDVWKQSAQREVHAVNYIHNALALLIRDIKPIANVSPDGTPSGWRMWTRMLGEASSKAELLQCVLQIEETIYAMSDAPRMVLNNKKAHPEVIIQSTNDELNPQHGAPTDVPGKESGQNVDDDIAEGGVDDAGSLKDKDAAAYVQYENEWWELIIPGDTATAKRRLWRTDKERLIWQEAMTTANSIARIAYGVAMLVSYSRQLIITLERQRQAKAAAALRAEAMEDREFTYERGGYRHY
jgi:hypothetical protein